MKKSTHEYRSGQTASGSTTGGDLVDPEAVKFMSPIRSTRRGREAG